MSCIVFDEVKHCKSFITVHLPPVSARFRRATEEPRCAIAAMGRDRATFEHAAEIRSGFEGAGPYILMCLWDEAPSWLLPSLKLYNLSQIFIQSQTLASGPMQDFSAPNPPRSSLAPGSVSASPNHVSLLSLLVVLHLRT